MKWIVVCMVFSAAPHWMAAALAAPADDAPTVHAQVYVVSDDGTVDLRTVGEDCDAAVQTLNVVLSDDGTANTIKQVDRLVTVRAAASDEEQAWLGVSIGPVPPAVAAQTGTRDRGAIILNVVKDSPADVAGLKEHDIIVSIESQDADGDINNLVRLISGHQPGDQVPIVVLRNGKEHTFQAKLSSRTELTGDVEWKFATPSLAEVEEEIRTRGKIVRRGPGDEWIVEDLGELDVLSDLPASIRTLIPQSGTKTIQMFLDDDHHTVTTRVEQDGTALEITREGEGEIVVKRVDQNGNETSATYADEDELREADEEAFEAFKGVIGAELIKIDVDGWADLDDFDFDFDIDFDVNSEDWQDHLDIWQANLDEALQKANAAVAEALEEADATVRQYQNSGGDPPAIAAIGPFMLGKPRHTFEVRVDGTIEVKLRKGDSELIQLYSDEADLAQRAPELHEKYTELMSAGD